MTHISPESPEERLKREALQAAHGEKPRRSRGSRIREVLKRVGVGVYSEGFIHAGNLAYLSLLSLFPFIIVTAAVARLLGETEGGMRTFIGLLQYMPPDVAKVLSKPIHDVLAARSGSLLWFGAVVGLWTTGGFIETIRDIIRRAYGVRFSRPFWEYRLGSMGIIIGAVLLAMMAFAISVFLTGLEQVRGIEFLIAVLTDSPLGKPLVNIASALRVVPALMLYGSLYLIFVSLTPKRYRRMSCRKWPGAAFVTLWWMATTALLPVILANLGSYDLTYGSLAGVMISLIFFFMIGLGLVIGAHLNAALAEPPEPTLQDIEKAKAEERAE